MGEAEVRVTMERMAEERKVEARVEVLGEAARACPRLQPPAPTIQL